MKAPPKALIAITLLGVACSLLWFWYSPEHYMREVDFATVTVDGQLTPADEYVGHPTYDEAEAFLLVNVKGTGSYLLNFEGDTFREISSREFIRLHGCVLTLRPMSKGQWIAPLPFQNVNEFRVASSKGHLVIVKF